LPFVLVLIVLGALWAIVLVPPLLRSRTERTSDSIGDFNHRLGVLSRTNDAVRTTRPMVPRRAPSAAKRRRDVLTVLIGAVLLTMLLAQMSGSTAVWALQLIADVALIAYVGLWAYFRSLQTDRAAKVRELPQRQRRAPELALRRTGSS
jgi:hypothetical protein